MKDMQIKPRGPAKLENRIRAGGGSRHSDRPEDRLCVCVSVSVWVRRRALGVPSRSSDATRWWGVAIGLTSAQQAQIRAPYPHSVVSKAAGFPVMQLLAHHDQRDLTCCVTYRILSLELEDSWPVNFQPYLGWCSQTLFLSHRCDLFLSNVPIYKY